MWRRMAGYGSGLAGQAGTAQNPAQADWQPERLTYRFSDAVNGVPATENERTASDGLSPNKGLKLTKPGQLRSFAA